MEIAKGHLKLRAARKEGKGVNEMVVAGGEDDAEEVEIVAEKSGNDTGKGKARAQEDDDE
jgi:hypothetical protein